MSEPAAFLARLSALHAKVDAFFAQGERLHAADLQCNTGCSDCCHVQLTVTTVEAAAIEQHLPTLPVEIRSALRTRAQAARADTVRCPALNAENRCAIYEARPLVCRSHGLPIRLRTPGHLDVVTACHRNFTHEGPQAAQPEAILDQATLSTVLLAVDAGYSAAAGKAIGLRTPLSEVLAQS